MVDDSDQMLIRAYARCRCEQSFAELVRRHVNLLHSTALRMLRDSGLTEEVNQVAWPAMSRHANHSIRFDASTSPGRTVESTDGNVNQRKIIV